MIRYVEYKKALKKVKKYRKQCEKQIYKLQNDAINEFEQSNGMSYNDFINICEISDRADYIFMTTLI